MNSKWDLRLVISICLCAAMIAGTTFSSFRHGNKQTDFTVYYSAALAFKEGLNPYVTDNMSTALGRLVPSPYNYPPGTLYIFLPLAYVDLLTAARIFLALKIVAVALLLFLWNRIFDLKEHAYLLFLIAPLAFNATLLDDLSCGNISVFEQLFLWIGFYCYTRDQLAGFAVGVILGSLFKLVTLLLLLLLITRLRTKDFVCLVVTGTGVLLMLGLNALIWPQMFAGFVDHMLKVSGFDRGELNPATLIFLKDIVAWVSLKSGQSLPSLLTSGIYLILVGCTLVVAVRTFAKLQPMTDKKADLWRICLICLLYAVLMPRLKNYSYIVIVAPALYAVLSRPLAKPWVPFCILLVFYTYRQYNVMGNALAPFYRAQSEYYSLLLAWLITGLFCYSFLRDSSHEPEKDNDLPAGRLEPSEKSVAAS